MACKRRYLCAPINEISGAQLPSSGEVLGLLTYKLDVEKMTVVDASWKVSKIVEALWAKARIPMQRIDTVVKNIQILYKEYTLVRKNKARTTGTQVKRGGGVQGAPGESLRRREGRRFGDNDKRGGQSFSSRST